MNAARRPRNEAGVLIERVGQHPGVGHSRHHDGDDAVLVEVKRFRHRRRECDFTSVGRPARIRVGSLLRDRDRHGPGVDGDDRDVGAAAIRRIVRDAMVERDLASVGRPVETADHEGSLRQLARGRPAEVEQVQVRVALILIFQLDVTPPLLAFLHRFGDGILHRERHLFAGWRPRERIHAVLGAGQTLGFAAAERNAIQLALAVAVRDEREPCAVGRPRRLHARLARIGDLARLAGCGVADPDLGFVGVLVPVGLADRERHLPAIGRDGRRADALQVDQVVDGWRRLVPARKSPPS